MTVALAPLLRILHEVGCRPSNKQQQLTQMSTLSPDRRSNSNSSGGPVKTFFPAGTNAKVVAVTN